MTAQVDVPWLAVLLFGCCAQGQRSIQTKVFIRLGASPPANGNKANRRNIQPFIFTHAVFSLLDFWTLEDGTNMT